MAKSHLRVSKPKYRSCLCLSKKVFFASWICFVNIYRGHLYTTKGQLLKLAATHIFKHEVWFVGGGFEIGTLGLAARTRAVVTLVDPANVGIDAVANNQSLFFGETAFL